MKTGFLPSRQHPGFKYKYSQESYLGPNDSLPHLLCFTYWATKKIVESEEKKREEEKRERVERTNMFTKLKIQLLALH